MTLNYVALVCLFFSGRQEPDSSCTVEVAFLSTNRYFLKKSSQRREPDVRFREHGSAQRASSFLNGIITVCIHTTGMHILCVYYVVSCWCLYLCCTSMKHDLSIMEFSGYSSSVRYHRVWLFATCRTWCSLLWRNTACSPDWSKSWAVLVVRSTHLGFWYVVYELVIIQGQK